MTGFTARMGGDQTKNDPSSSKYYLSTAFLLAEILTHHLGQKVEHRRVQPGDDLSKYDLALLGINPLGSPADRADYVAGTAWAFARARCPKLLFCEDWQVEEVTTQFRCTLRRWEKYAQFKKYRPDDGGRVQAMLASILDERWPLLTSFFPWGNHDVLFRRNLAKAIVHGWDPSPFYRLPDMKAHGEKSRGWTYATLQKHDKWLANQNLTWPVTRYEKANRISETQLVREEYPKRWGILAPRYKSAGSGWWRVRFNHAAHVGAVMVCDREDARLMGRPYQVSPQAVERMSLDELATVAQNQREWFYAHIATRDKTVADLDAALQAAMAVPISKAA